MRIEFAILVLLTVSCSFLWGGGQAEMAAPERGEYLAGKGIIIPPEEIYEDSYVSAVDYQYPDPDGSFGVRFYSGHRQLSTDGQEEIFLIAIQGRRPAYEDLPTMNHVFVIDKSGSMYQRDKLNWVKESFAAFMGTVRAKDFVSLVVFDDTARTVFPSTQMNRGSIRERFTEAVHSIQPGGGSNVKSALQLAYKEVLSNYREDYLNRVFFLTDGVGDIEEIYGIADVYREIGVNVTAIGMGEDCDLDFLRDLADRAGGGARFLSSREKIEEIFGEDFIRMVIPAARNIELKLHLLESLQNVKTWGYHSKIEGVWDLYEQTGEAVPYALATDLAGNVFIADDAKNRIQKFNSQGAYLAEWGRTGKRDWNPKSDADRDEMEGKFFHPRGLAVDPEGYVYVADSGNDRVQKFDSNGTFRTQWGGPGKSRGKFKRPNDIAVDRLGHLYVADTANHRIQKFDGAGNFITQWGSEGSENGQFRSPVAVAVDAYCNVFVADSGNQRLQIFESDGTFITTLAGIPASPVDVAVDAAGSIFVADSGKVRKYDIDRAHLTEWGSFGDKNGTFSSISAITLDDQGNILVADADRRSIQKFDGTGNFMIKQPLNFFIPTINLGDYETIVIQATIPERDSEGIRTIARLTGTYTDMEGNKVAIDPVDLTAKFVRIVDPVSGISNATVLRAATVLHYAQALKEIGVSYYAGRVRSAVDLAHETKSELWNAQFRLGDGSLAKEISILEKYISIMSPEANLNAAETQALVQGTELKPRVQDRSFEENIDNMFEEMLLDLRDRQPGSIAVTGFSFQDNRSAEMLNVLNDRAESALTAIANLTNHSLVATATVTETLRKNAIDRSDLIDTNTAIQVGELLAAKYILTGTVLEMSESVLVFCRVIDVHTGAIISVSQVIIPMNIEVRTML